MHPYTSLKNLNDLELQFPFHPCPLLSCHPRFPSSRTAVTVAEPHVATSQSSSSEEEQRCRKDRWVLGRGEKREEKQRKGTHMFDTGLHTDQCIALRKSKNLFVIFSGFCNVPVLVHLLRCCVRGIHDFFSPLIPFYSSFHPSFKYIFLQGTPLDSSHFTLCILFFTPLAVYAGYS